MKVLYHLPVLPPQLPEAEALSQEIEILRSHFRGDLVYVNPNNRSPLPIPRLLFGFQRLRELWHREAEIDLHHIYNPEPFAYPILRWLKRPVIYSITGGAGTRPPNIKFFNSLGAVTVLDEASLQQLQQWGIRRVFLVRPGIDVTRFTPAKLPLDNEIRLLMASAPWTIEQFASKGVDALLEAVKRDPRLHITFLWRGVLSDEMRKRIQQLDLSERVNLIDELVDVNKILATVHATVLLATTTQIVKAYPHSLLDSLAAGKPVLVSRAIPMASYVEKTGCGKVVEKVNAAAISEVISQLRASYQRLESAAIEVGKRDFSESAMINSYRIVYEDALRKNSKMEFSSAT